MPNFIGTGNRITLDDLRAYAAGENLPLSHVRAVLKVETRGRGFGPKNRPIILFEPHIFDRMLRKTKPKNDELLARRRGLSHPRWHRIPYVGGNDRNYRRLFAAIEINRAAALQSCSWGIGQVMGFNYRTCGFSSVEKFVEYQLRGEIEQFDTMLRFMKRNKLVTKLRAGNIEGFVRGYNGSGQVAKYSAKIRAAIKKFQ